MLDSFGELDSDNMIPFLGTNVSPPKGTIASVIFRASRLVGFLKVHWRVFKHISTHILYQVTF